MQKTQLVDLNPDLIISRDAAIDRMGYTASVSASQGKPYFDKQIQLVRRIAKGLCEMYKNCREEDWCWHCSSGQHGPLFRGDACLNCKLLTADAHLEHKTRLVQIGELPSVLTDSPVDNYEQS